MLDFKILIGDALEQLRTLPEASVDCCVTSPPYWGLRDYGHAGQLGLEPTPADYVKGMVAVFQEVRRVLTPAGTLWVNLGDTYAGSRGGGPPSTSSTLLGNGHKGGGPKLRGMTQSRRRDDAPCPRSDIQVPGLKPKDLVGIPWRVAFALQEDGWYLRSDIIWSKPNPMPSSVKDRPTTSHEHLFLLAKSERYFYDWRAIAEPLAESTLREIAAGAQDPSAVKARIIAGKRGKNETTGDRTREGFNERWDASVSALVRNKRSVWTIPTQPFKGAHFATFPEALVRPCILAGSAGGGVVIDPFCGSGTVGAVALKEFRRFVGIEINPTYATMAARRIQAAVPGPSLNLND